MLAAGISLTLSRHSSLSFIALGRSSGQQPVSSHSCWMYVRAGRPAFARPCVGIHKSTSLMSSSLLLQQCPACLVRLTWIVFVIGGRWPYSWCLVGCCCQFIFEPIKSVTFLIICTYIWYGFFSHFFIFYFISFLFIYINSQYIPMFFKKKSIIYVNLNLALYLHLAINSHTHIHTHTHTYIYIYI